MENEEKAVTVSGLEKFEAGASRSVDKGNIFMPLTHQSALRKACWLQRNISIEMQCALTLDIGEGDSW